MTSSSSSSAAEAAAGSLSSSSFSPFSLPLDDDDDVSISNNNNRRRRMGYTFSTDIDNATPANVDMETTLSPEIVNIMKNRNKNMKHELYCTHKENDPLKQENKYMKQTQTLPQRTHTGKELLKQENKLFHIQHNIIQNNNEKRLLKQEIQQQQANKIVGKLLLK